MDDEDIFEDVPRDANSLVIPKDVFERASSKDKLKYGKPHPTFVPAVKITKSPQIPFFRPAQPKIVEATVEQCANKDVISVFSSTVPNDYFPKNYNYAATDTSTLDYKLSSVDPDTKSNAMSLAKSNVSNMRGSASAIVNQKLDSTHQPEYGGYEAMKDRLTESSADNRFNQVYARQTMGNPEQPSASRRRKKCNKTFCLWLCLFLLLLLILGFLLYSLFGCKKDCKDHGSKKFDNESKGSSAKGGERDYDEDFSLMTAESMESSEKLPRLNPAIFPTAYYITIITDFTRFEYNLRVHILIYINEITNIIIIHGSNYNLNAYVGLVGPENEIYDIATVNLELDTELMVLTLNRSTVIGEYNLTMHYSGVIETEIGGYYRISYKSPNSHNISWLALTDFKPDKAHLLFPCFDHPMFKATFSLVFGLLDSKSFTISNMGKVEQRWRRKREIGIRNITDMEVYSWDHYDTTPLITTLGLAFIAVPNKDDFGFKDKNFVHYFYRKHLSKEMEFAMDMTNAIVGYFEAYFNSLYSLPNLHIFAVPNLNKYGVGSWGIILLSESQILNDPKGVNPNKAMYPIEQRKQVILNLSHKLVSQWFGTSVTMSDITEDWIFEGFALYMKYRALNSISKDEWNDPGHFNVEIMQPLLLMESLIPTVKYHENHEYVPDAAKGAVLMRMMENMITKETFDSAIMKLTDNKKLQVAGFMDICELLSDEAQTKQTLSQDLNLCDFLKPYVKQRGYPVLKLSRNYVTNGAMITQQQFILGNQIAEKFSESNDSLKNDEQMWVVPTSIINKGCGATGTQPKTWMPQKEEFSVGILTSNDWALLNNGGTGLYRVNYDKRNWDMIKKQLNTNYEEIATVNRAQIIDDVLNLARANMVDYYLAFEIIKYLPKEVEYIPWAAALNNFEFFDMMLIKTPQYGTFKKFVSILITDVYQSRCDEKKESDEGTYAVQLHNLIGQWACHLDHPACTQYSIRKFYEFKANPQHNSISVEGRYMVYCTAIRSTTYAEWNFLWKQYLASDNQFEKELILKSLACTYDPWIIEWYLWHIVSPNTDEILIQPIHYAIIIEHLAKNPVASSVVIDKLLKHWKTFRKLSRSNTILAHMIKSTFFYMNTEPEYDLFKNWSRNNGDKMKEDYELFQHIEAAIENNIFFMKTYMWQVVTWMQSYVQNNTHRLPVSCDEEQNHPGFGSGPNKILGGSPFDSTNNDTFKPFDSNRTLPESPFTNPPGSFPPNIVHSPESPRSPLNVVIDEFSSTKVRQAPISSTTPRQAPDIMPSKLNTNDLEPQPKLLDQNQQNASEPKPSEQVQQRQMESSDKLVPSNAYSSENERSQKPSANNPEGPKIQKDDKFLPLDQRSDLEKFVNDLTQTIPDKKEGRTKEDGREQEKETTAIEDEFEGGIKEKKGIEAKNSTLSSSDHV